MGYVAYKVKIETSTGTPVRESLFKIPVLTDITTVQTGYNWQASEHITPAGACAAHAIPFRGDGSFFGDRSGTADPTYGIIATACGFSNLQDFGTYFNYNNMKIWFDDRHYVRVRWYSNSNHSTGRLDFFKDDALKFTYPDVTGVGGTWPDGYAGGGYIKARSFPWLNNRGYLLDYSLSVQYTIDSLDPLHVSLDGVRDLYISGVNASNNTAVLSWFTDLPEPVDTDDPYVDIPNSQPSGPAEGVGIPATDSVDIPSLPTVSATDTGFVSLFNPTMVQVKDLADYMWAGLFDIATFKKIFADPMDCILGFNMVPVAVPSGAVAAVRVGNISTGVQMNKATSQWVELDCGTVTMDLPYGSYLDYSPYTKVSLYLPYIGMVELSTDDVMGRVLSLKYHVDVLSCACVAYLKCGPDVLYQFTGSCGYSIPITGDNFRQMISNIVSLAATIGGAVISGGAAVPVVTGAMTAKQAAKAAAKAAAMKQAQAAATIGAAESAAHSVMGSKPDVHRSGALGSSAGLMGIQKPFLIMEIPNACKPKKQYHYLGYPGFITVKVGDLTGYAEFESIILDGIPCTEDERDQIAALCAGGIYL